MVKMTAAEGVTPLEQKFPKIRERKDSNELQQLRSLTQSLQSDLDRANTKINQLNDYIAKRDAAQREIDTKFSMMAEQSARDRRHLDRLMHIFDRVMDMRSDD